MHWAAKYIGIPYRPAARGPEEVDCWGLVHLAYRNEFGIDLPLYPGISLEKPVECSDVIARGLAEDWMEVSCPFDGALVAMGQRKEIHHIGLYASPIMGEGRILHCWHSQSSVADTIRGLRLRGMRQIHFYQYRLWPTS